MVSQGARPDAQDRPTLLCHSGTPDVSRVTGSIYAMATLCRQASAVPGLTEGGCTTIDTDQGQRDGPQTSLPGTLSQGPQEGRCAMHTSKPAIVLAIAVVMASGWLLASCGPHRPTAVTFDPPYPERNARGDPIRAVYEG